MFTGLGIGSEGSYADYAVIAEAQAVAKPASLSFEQAAAMGLVFPTAHYALVRRAADCSQARRSSCRAAPAASAAPPCRSPAPSARACWPPFPHEEDARAVEELGADRAIVRTAVDVGAEVKRLTDGHGVDVIVEPAPADNLAVDLTALAKGGRVVVVGAGSARPAHVPAGAAEASTPGCSS